MEISNATAHFQEPVYPVVSNCSSLSTKNLQSRLYNTLMFSASPAVFAMFSLLRARWGKVNSLGIERMKGVLLWLRTKGSLSLSSISETCTGLFVGELDVPYCVSQHFEWGLSPPSVVTQIPHVFWHSKLKSPSCLVQSVFP